MQEQFCLCIDLSSMPGAAIFPGSREIGLFEGVKQLGNFIGGNTDTAILDAKAQR